MNIYKAFNTILSLLMIIGFVSCSSANGQENTMPPPTSPQFNDYWYSGKAELTRYKLEQSRYGEVHEGDAVLIFVTEDFRTDKQVKYEGGDRKNVAPILKLNFTKKFFTGIYPYSLITSTFTPVDEQLATLKVATSVQEWCGHTYSQLNLKKNKYKGRLHSYFQAEGDQEFELDAVLLEDEIWTKIRLNPQALPTGTITLIPGSQYLRLKHRDIAVEKAKASLELTEDATLSTKPLNKYRIEYQGFNRVLEITFETEFPYAIVAWEEQSQGGTATRAVRTHTMNSAYWGQHGVEDAKLKEKLGLGLNNY